MNLEEVKLSQLRALVAVAAHSNFSEAASTLSISQSAVSHAIATLEAQLGVILLYRGRQGASLTPVGERILKHAQDMLRSLSLLGKEADLSKGLQGGQVRIASFRSVATHVLPEVISKFRENYPAIAVTITEYRGDEGVEEPCGMGDRILRLPVCLLPRNLILGNSCEMSIWCCCRLKPKCQKDE